MLKVKIISGTVDPLYDISNAARMCTNTQDKNDIRTRESFVRARIRNGEENLLEHAYVQLEISGISRSCLQQLVRHRYHVVYSVQSQRYVDQSNAEFVVPLSLRGTTMESQFLAFCGVALDNYKKLLERAVSVTGSDLHQGNYYLQFPRVAPFNPYAGLSQSTMGNPQLGPRNPPRCG